MGVTVSSVLVLLEIEEDGSAYYRKLAAALEALEEAGVKATVTDKKVGNSYLPGHSGNCRCPKPREPRLGIPRTPPVYRGDRSARDIDQAP